MEFHVSGTCEVDDYAAGALDGRIEERAVDRLLNSGRRSALTGSTADTHVADTCICHDTANVSKVEVDETRDSNEVGNTGNTKLQYLVGHIECIINGCVFISDIEELVICDYDQGVNILLDLADTTLSVHRTARAFETERTGNNCNSQDAEFTSDLGNYRSSTCTGTTTHTCGDEQHICSADRLSDLIFTFFSSLLANRRICAASETSGDLLTDLDRDLRLRTCECLMVCINGNKIDALNRALDHTIDRVTSAAADTDYFYCCKWFIVHRVSELKI